MWCVQLLETTGEALVLLRQFDALDRGRGWIADGVGGLDRLQAPAGAARAQPVDRPVRAIATIQVIGLARPGSNVAALRHTVT